jgi:hypothetical protein
MAVRALLHYALEIHDFSVGERFYRYIRDPWGSFAEYFFDLDHIPESCAWEPRDFPEQDALYRWGPKPPPDFGENKELG